MDTYIQHLSPLRIGGSALNLLRESISLAQKVIHELVDDIDGSEATESVTFSYQGVTYELDLSTKNAGKLDKALAPYVAAGRKVKPIRLPGRTPARSSSGAEPKAIREWARDEGIEVSDRGRVSADVIRRYQEAQG